MVSRTIELNDLTPQELAALFCEMNNDDQADFLNEIDLIARSWAGAGWCQQSCEIVRSKALMDGGRRTISALAEHLELANGEA